MITSFLVIIFFLGWYFFFFWPKAKKTILSTQPRKKILTNKRSYSSNGNTFMPMIWSFYANPFLYFLGVPKTFLKCWGFLLRTNNKTNFNDVCSVCTPTPKIEISMISAAVYWKYIPNTEGFYLNTPPPLLKKINNFHFFQVLPLNDWKPIQIQFFFCIKVDKSDFSLNTPLPPLKSRKFTPGRGGGDDV